jgi:tetratricopeptide (TPR) repeat protein
MQWPTTTEEMLKRDWDSGKAVADYLKAADTAPNFAFARANYALALYQTGKTNEAIRNMRNIVRKYPNFADMRAAITAAYWVEGKRGKLKVTGLQRLDLTDVIRT